MIMSFELDPKTNTIKATHPEHQKLVQGIADGLNKAEKRMGIKPTAWNIQENTASPADTGSNKNS